MRHGFIKVAAVTPKVRVADPVYNGEQIRKGMDEAYEKGAKIIVFPELCITAYTCGDLFYQNTLLHSAVEELKKIAAHSEGRDSLIFVGLPLEKEHKLYNTAAVLQNGKVLALIPKTFLPGYAEFNEPRYFSPAQEFNTFVQLGQERIPFGTRILFDAEGMDGLTVGCEICEDIWGARTPGTAHTMAGATIMVNLSASDESAGKADYRRMLLKSSSARLMCGYIYTSAGEGESTTDLVFGGHNLIAENGTILAEAEPFSGMSICADIDIQKLYAGRRRMNVYQPRQTEEYQRILFRLEETETRLERTFEPLPFVPANRETREKRCEELFNIQAYGLKKRLEHTGGRNAVIGISGGLDSTLALLVTVTTFDLLSLDRKGICAVTMPCFGTTDRTYDNACRLADTLGVTLREIDIKNAVRTHFKDIGQDEQQHDVTYENAQARERTQILMDIANQNGGMVIGTGDMSELALGWATYNGDHMSMYAVNAGIPKTLLKFLVSYYAVSCGSGELERLLQDVLDTPVSPELLPPVDGKIAQKTEELVGPYELHDFFLYYMLRCCFTPSKIYRIAKQAFAGKYEEETIRKWLKIFYQRFFSQQFKRSCMPDGPKTGSVGLSPRGDLHMPSDASAAIWLEEIEHLS